MLCDNCHASNAAGAKFCAVCGEPLPEKALVHKQGQGTGHDYVEGGYSYDDGFSGRKEDYNNGRHANRQNDYEYYPENNYGQNGGYDRYDYQYNNQYANDQYSYNQYGGNQYGKYPNGYDPYYGSQYGNGGYGLQQKQQRSVGAIVFYMLSGALSLITMAMLLLPSIDNWLGTDIGLSANNRYQSVFQYIGELLKGTGVYKDDKVIAGIILLNLFLLPTIFQLLWAIFSFTRLRAAGAMGLVGSILYSTTAMYWLLHLLNVFPFGRLYFKEEITRINIDTSKYITAVPYYMVVLSIVGIVFSAIQISKRNRVR